VHGPLICSTAAQTEIATTNNQPAAEEKQGTLEQYGRSGPNLRRGAPGAVPRRRRGVEQAARRDQQATPAPRGEPGPGRSEPRRPADLGGGGEERGFPGKRRKRARERLAAADGEAAGGGGGPPSAREPGCRAERHHERVWGLAGAMGWGFGCVRPCAMLICGESGGGDAFFFLLQAAMFGEEERRRRSEAGRRRLEKLLQGTRSCLPTA
jgi:hypothetical protein